MPRPDPGGVVPVQVVAITGSEAMAEWDAFVGASPEGTIFQCSAWSLPLEIYRIETEVLVWRGLDGIDGGILLRRIPIPGTPYAIFRAIGGPIIKRWDPPVASALVNALAVLAKHRRVITTELFECSSAQVHGEFVQALEGAGQPFKRASGSARAALDLVGVEPGTVHGRFNQNTRRSIKRGHKAGIVVRDLASPEEVQAAYTCWKATMDRKNIPNLRPWPTLEPLIRHFLDTGRGWLLGGVLGDRLHSAILVANIGPRPLYLYGGFMDGSECLFPNHLLHEEAILRCLRLHKSGYDMGGLDAPIATPPSGVTQFKVGFGVAVTYHPDTLQWHHKPLLARALASARQLISSTTLMGMVRKRVLS